MHTCLGTFVQRTLNSGQSSATTSLTDSFRPFVHEKRKLVMADEAPMLVQQVLLTQMRLLVLLVPQVQPLVLRRLVYYHVTYFAFAITPPDRLSTNVLARICSSISTASISASL